MCAWLGKTAVETLVDFLYFIFKGGSAEINMRIKISNGKKENPCQSK